MQRNGLPFESEGIFITNVLSHICILPTLRQLIQRRWTFEATLSVFTMCSSFMYHLTQALQSRIFYEELDWHKIDNFGAISSFGIWLTYVAAIQSPVVDQYCKYSTIMIAVFSQVAYPWEIIYTITPIALFAMMPVVTFCLRYINATGPPLARLQAAASVYNMREAAIGLGLLVAALFCFHLGLDEKNDPYRIFHGGWHAFGGFSALHLWRMVHKPTADKAVLAVGGGPATSASVIAGGLSSDDVPIMGGTGKEEFSD